MLDQQNTQARFIIVALVNYRVPVQHLSQEYKEHEDLPNTTNPDDWAKISGKKGERIIFIRTLLSADDEFDGEGGRAIERVQTGQYL